MTSRILPVGEWEKLDATIMRAIWRQFNPAFVQVIVVENAHCIVGSIALMMTLHAECAEIHGGIGVRRALWNALQARVADAGGMAVWGAAVDDEMRILLSRHGTPIPGEHFLVRM